MQPHEGHPTAGGQERQGKSEGLLHTEGRRDRTLNVQDRDAAGRVGELGWTAWAGRARGSARGRLDEETMEVPCSAWPYFRMFEMISE